MGEVYRARDTRLDRTVAIKIVSEQLSNSTTSQRFEREARAISSLNHPNICTLHDIGREMATSISFWNTSKGRPWPRASGRDASASTKCFDTRSRLRMRWTKLIATASFTGI